MLVLTKQDAYRSDPTVGNMRLLMQCLSCVAPCQRVEVT